VLVHQKQNPLALLLVEALALATHQQTPCWYTGLNIRPAACCRYAVGLFNRDTNRLRLVPMAGDGVAVRLEPRIKGVQYIPKAATAEEVAARAAAAEDLAHQRQRNVK
jgi:hypothetical protein